MTEIKRKKKHTALRVVLLSIAALLLSIVLVFVSLMYVIPALETADRTEVNGSKSWMAALDDELYLSEVILPGAHDAATKNVQLAFFSKCQDLTVREQLDAGFRYLDIRLDAEGSDMKLMHGFVSCTVSGWPWAKNLYVSSVISDCVAFLKKNPTETIVFAVKQDNGDESVETFEKTLDAMIKQNAEYWLLTDTIPQLADARGKIVLMRRYRDEAGLGTDSGIPLYWADQGGRDDTSRHITEENNGSYTLYVQDRYKYESDEKWEAFTAGIKAGRVSATDVSIHFLSTNGSPKFGHPYRYAKELNERFTRNETAVSGWIIVDFASATIAETIYSQNF